MSEKVLILGGGGREHALAQALEAAGAEVYGLPGNAGFARGLPAEADRVAQLRRILRQTRFDFVVLGSEQPAADGETDLVRNEFPDVFVVGPSQAAARLESSKAFAKRLMQKYGVPTAGYDEFTDPGEAEKHIRRRFAAGAPKMVVKADGLAAGKGVVVAADPDEAAAAARAMLDGTLFGDAGKTVVVEEFLDGVEASVFILSDGRDYLLLPSATDYKRRFDGDAGPNTGGMGAVSPSPHLNDKLLTIIKDRVVAPTIAAIRAEKLEYPGFLFFGLMLCAGAPFVLEYNVRLGDPETQAVLPRIVSPSLLDVFKALRDGRLGEVELKVSPKTAVTVVCVGAGYPGQHATGEIVAGLENVEAPVFLAGARRDPNGQIRTAGGRVLAVTGLGDDLPSARNAAYQAVAGVCFESIDFRRDIGTF